MVRIESRQPRTADIDSDRESVYNAPSTCECDERSKKTGVAVPKLYLAEESGVRTLELTQDEPVTVGRSAQNTIVIQDLRSSRRHCRFEYQGEIGAATGDEGSEDRFRVVDLGSQNGTFVNGAPVSSQPLQAGDLIEIGSIRIYFDREPDPAADEPERRSTAIRETVTPSGGVAGVSPAAEAPSSIDSDAGEFGPDLARLKQERSNLLRLQRINRAINSELEVERLLEIILDSAIELTEAERGFLIVKEGDGLGFRVARNFDRESLEHPEFSISKSVAQQVLADGKPVLTLNAQEDERFVEMQSVDTLGLRSLLCVPFRVKDRILGTVYLDNRLHKGVFSDEDLRLLQTLADQAGIAIENANLVRALRASKQEVEGLNQALEAKVASQSVELTEVRERLRTSQQDLHLKYDYANIVGQSRRMREVFQLLDRVVDSEVPVLVHGASGTGKELVAKAIHYNGPRRDGPFVSENCGAVSESLLESELFGYVKGSFTGANRDKKGLFEVAAGGTLFLDEVSNMSVEMQKKLLRVLQERELRRVGGKETISIDVRLISASNRDLREMVAEGEFREDLFYRLQVITVSLPPLRDRRDDIPLLVRHFLARTCAEENRDDLAISSDIMARFLDYAWPGNVRELENEVRRLVALADEAITLDLVSPHIREGKNQFRSAAAEGPIRNLNTLVEEVERLEILKALEQHKHNKTRAAEALGISRFTLQRKLEKYGIS